MLRPKPNIEKMARPVHGGIDAAELERFGFRPEEAIDFSVSVNPFGPPPGIEKAIAAAAIDRYPDSESTQVRESVAKKFDLSADNVIIGSGSTELIRLIAMAYFGPYDLVLIPHPTYGEYDVACDLVGARTLKPWMLGEPDFRLDLPRILTLVEEHRPTGLFLCNPNNPTGEYLSRDTVNSLLYHIGSSIMVMDEAYLAFSDAPWQSTELLETGRLIIVRSMTKDFALPGLRLGYALGPKQLVSTLNRIKPPWNVSSVAQAAARFALDNDDYVVECGKKVREAREFLISGLRTLGYRVVPSSANFFLVKVSDAAAFRQALLAEGLVVRDCASFGLPTYIRLAPRTIPECERLLAAIDTPEVRGHAG